MKKFIKIIIILFFIPGILNAAEMTVGLNSAFGMYDSNWKEQKHYSTTNTYNTGYYHNDPWIFFEPEISFRIDNRWHLIAKVTFTSSKEEMENEGMGNYFKSENDYIKLNWNITLRHYFTRYMYINTGIDINYLTQDRYIDDPMIGAYIDYNLETILPGTFLGIGFYVKIYKGLYFKFVTSSLFQYGITKMDVKDHNYGILPFEIVTKDKPTMAFGQNAAIAFGYYFKNAGVDIALTFNSQYLMYKQEENKDSDFDNIDGKDEKLLYLGLKVSYTFSLTGKVRPWEESKGDKIWIPTRKGKSIWL